MKMASRVILEAIIHHLVFFDCDADRLVDELQNCCHLFFIRNPQFRKMLCITLDFFWGIPNGKVMTCVWCCAHLGILS